MLEIYFNRLNAEKVSQHSNKTRFHELIDEFRDQNLAEERVFKVSMNVENVFLWRYLCDFCKTNQIERLDLKTNVERNGSEEQISEQIPVISDENQSTNPVNEETVQNVDVFDSLVPDVPIFCNYIEK